MTLLIELTISVVKLYNKCCMNNDPKQIHKSFWGAIMSLRIYTLSALWKTLSEDEKDIKLTELVNDLNEDMQKFNISFDELKTLLHLDNVNTDLLYSVFSLLQKMQNE